MSLSSGHTDKNISVSVSSSQVPEPSLAAEALDLHMDERSHQKPSENLDPRESSKNAENNQSIALTPCNLVQMKLNLILSLSCQIIDLFNL